MKRFTLFLFAIASVLSSSAQTLTEELVYQRLMARKNAAKYAEGAPWTNDTKYTNTVWFMGKQPGYWRASGCFALKVDMMEYCSNYEYAVERIEASYNNLPKLHVGDGVRIKNDTHSVVVLEVAADGHTVTVVEGNYNSSVHWGRVIDLANSSTGIAYVCSFWPNVYLGIGRNEMDPTTRDITIFSLSGVQLKNVPQTEMSVSELLNGLPKGHYIVKEGSKTYKVFNSNN